MTNTMEYSETKRNKLELELANKRELINERRYGLDIIIYWLRTTNTISMTLIENNNVREFLIPNDRVLDARDHAESYANLAGMYRSRSDDEEWNGQPWQQY